MRRLTRKIWMFVLAEPKTLEARSELKHKRVFATSQAIRFAMETGSEMNQLKIGIDCGKETDLAGLVAV